MKQDDAVGCIAVVWACVCVVIALVWVSFLIWGGYTLISWLVTK